jgi:PAS domain S-box-containing protein
MKDVCEQAERFPEILGCTEKEREIAIEFLHFVNTSRGTRDLVRKAATFFQERSGCQAVGIRLREGDDYPYFEARGFPREFVEAENRLCVPDWEAGSGSPVLECMCGNVLRGRIDPSQPFSTPRRSFWTNSTTQFLASTSEAERLGRTRNRCNGEGYESVALIPLRLGEERLGLLQLNDRRTGLFTPEAIDLWERLADCLAVALAKFRAEEALEESERRYRLLFENMLEGFSYCRMLFDDRGEPTDFVYLGVNAAFERLTGLANVVGKRVTDVIPGIKESHPELFATYGRVALTGKPEKFELEFKPLGAWLAISVYSTERERFVAVFDNITERKRAEEELRASEHNFRELSRQFNTLLDALPDSIFLLDATKRIAWANAASSQEFGIERADLPGTCCFKIRGDAGHHEECPGRRAFASGRPERGVVTTADGKTLELRAVPVASPGGRVENVIEIARDITAHRLLEEQLRHAQKMEALGTFAGGVAHDFNNLLTAIIGYGTLLQMQAGAADPSHKHINAILAAADRAANLTQGLLAYSRKEPLAARPVDLNEIVAKVDRLLSRVIGEDVELTVIPADSPLTIDGDAGQLEQVLMNLATNSRDAMPEGGDLVVEVREARPDESLGTAPGLDPEQRYVLLAVSDSGCGMDKATQERMFEPFYTTKGVGKGTGLGLSIAYGIISQHHGFVQVSSAPGKGTTFRIFLPLVTPPAQQTAAKAPASEWGKGETILLVEDSEQIRTFFRDLLTGYGYRVIEAADGADGVEKFRCHADEIDLLLLDVIMPRKNGKETYDEISAVRPAPKAIFMSGYTADVISRKGIDATGLNFLPKPLAPAVLLGKIREVLEGNGAAGG